MEEPEMDERCCGNCRFWALLWDDAGDQNRWLGVCRKARLEWRRRFAREHQGAEPTDLDMDDFLYEGLGRADKPGCGEFEDVG